MDGPSFKADIGMRPFDAEQVTDDFLASLDIAELNLRCAQGLPGSEDLDIEASLRQVDEWADRVYHATARNINLFNREPQRFENSLAKFYMAVLCAVLQRDCGVGYSPERAADPGDARNSRDRFLHGITHGDGGTCASLPVLYVAVGRRLGYPLKLVHGARHLFLRWDETEKDSCLAKDRFNIEATAMGFVSYPDRFYLAWPFPHPDPDVDPAAYLKSLTPREEVADFLCIRSIVLMDNGKFVQAIQPAAWARQLDPTDYSIQVHLEITMLLALGILDEKPRWVDEHPVIRPDGTTWSRYWWPRPVENRELLPAAKLPPPILSRLLPPNAATAPIGELADALYARATEYNDEARLIQIHQAAVAEQYVSRALQINAENRARQQAMIADVMRSQQQRAASALSQFGQHPTSHQPGLPLVPGQRPWEPLPQPQHPRHTMSSPWNYAGALPVQSDLEADLSTAPLRPLMQPTSFVPRGTPTMPRRALPTIQHPQ